eukprot:TRINITY_DN3142_c0_g2_i1.p1 TRINITY_DN3142_c0_g2~~TRINITY_DN3142_c0_g2_i1.p1  ORF type:complete len:257 (-),score=49.57 TRINITY_DN3142_c0_g2_i1:46-783(-)
MGKTGLALGFGVFMTLILTVLAVIGLISVNNAPDNYMHLNVPFCNNSGQLRSYVVGNSCSFTEATFVLPADTITESQSYQPRLLATSETGSITGTITITGHANTETITTDIDLNIAEDMKATYPHDFQLLQYSELATSPCNSYTEGCLYTIQSETRMIKLSDLLFKMGSGDLTITYDLTISEEDEPLGDLEVFILLQSIDGASSVQSTGFWLLLIVSIIGLALPFLTSAVDFKGSSSGGTGRSNF